MRQEVITISGVDTSRPRSLVLFLWRTPFAVVHAARLIRAFRADVVVGTAGYVCVPVVIAARLLRVPVVLLEQNAVPGRAIRLLARWSRCVAASYAETATRLGGARVVVTGNPVRATVTEAPPVPLGERCCRVLVTGGSQGARRLNRAVAGCVVELLEAHPDLTIAHQCGAAQATEAIGARDGLPQSLRERYQVRPFFDDIIERMRGCDLVVMRAGGSSLAEATALGRPMIVVPYPHAGAHQRMNALPYVRAGAAVLITDAECDGDRLRREIEALIGDPPRWREMAAASAAAGRPDAVERVVGLIREAAA